MRVVTPYEWDTGKLARPMTLIVVSDLHDEPFDDLLPALAGADALLAPGDLTNRYTGGYERGAAFLREAAKRLPVYFSIGNHETRQRDYRATLAALEATGARALVNRYERVGEIWLGGWYEPKIVGAPDMLDAFEALEGVKVLMCHKPQHYFKYLRGRDVDLVLAGHAHGGQIRLGTRGLYAPGQGLLPRWTRGVIDGRMIVSAGAGNPNRLPRWNNPTEALRVTLR